MGKSCGQIVIAPEKEAFTEGEQVTLTTAANLGFMFVVWEFVVWEFAETVTASAYAASPLSLTLGEQLVVPTQFSAALTDNPPFTCRLCRCHRRCNPVLP